MTTRERLAATVAALALGAGVLAAAPAAHAQSIWQIHGCYTAWLVQAVDHHAGADKAVGGYFRS
ncbi:hypothetical protein [Streptomyces sp. NPDC101115]|uniref:hypothetical protein n=1 Tax=Streptomyces sp. NPDC101115 TaxID=3366106 RepID=UPI0038263159